MLNVMSGDVLIGNVQKNIVCYDVIWGELFGNESFLYANVVIPYNNINLIKFMELDGAGAVFDICIKAPYHPVNQIFKIRFVTIVNGAYHLVSDYVSGIPDDMDCLCRMSFGSEPEAIEACKLFMINVDGCYKIVVNKSEEDIYSACLYSAYSYDFVISDNEDQSAQLLAICGPGKYYRYPTTGVDITKYINSVVHLTNIGENLYDQFKSDNKDISDADFDSTTGILDTRFNSYSVNDPNVQLMDVEDLDTRLFRFANDEYISAVVQALHDGTVVIDPEDLNTNTSTDTITSWMGIYSDDKVYNTKNIVSCYGSVFVAKSNGLRGVSPISVDGDGRVSLANTGSWDCIVNNIELYNTSLMTDRMVETTEEAMAKMIANRTWEAGVKYYTVESE